MPLTPGDMPNLEEIFLNAYTHLVGSYFWAFLLFLTVGAVYVRTRAFGPSYMVLAVGAFVLEVVLPGGTSNALIYFSIVVGITYSGYKFLVGR